MNGLKSLDAETAKALAGYGKGPLLLNGLTTLDADAAKALATCKGPLSLPNLKKISPKTLSALIAKEAVEIPLIETLSLIPEPDGGATKDVVIPKELEERQKRRQAQQRAE